MRTIMVAAAVLALGAGGASAQPTSASDAAVATVTRMTEAVNRGDMPTAFAAFTASPLIVEDIAPYSWQGPGAPQAWIAAMGANAQAMGVTAIAMKLSPASRVEVAGERAYATLPGLLSLTLKDGHIERAQGVLTFTLQRQGGDWKIDTLVWSGPAPKS